MMSLADGTSAVKMLALGCQLDVSLAPWLKDISARFKALSRELKS